MLTLWSFKLTDAKVYQTKYPNMRLLQSILSKQAIGENGILTHFYENISIKGQ